MPQDYLRTALDGVRTRLHAEVDAQLGLLGTQYEEALERALLEQVAESPAVSGAEALPAVSTVSHLLDAVTDMDRETGLSSILTALVREATVVAPRAALFLANGHTLDEWSVPGVPLLATRPLALDSPGAGLLADALRNNRAVRAGAAHEPPPPPMAILPAGRSAIAAPIAPGGQPVAVLYADEGLAGVAVEGWRELVELLARHASARLAYVTTIRTAEAAALMREPADPPSAAPVVDEQAARRYARLVVSEIKLYNEPVVREGCEQKDLQRRLGPEIARARQLYQEHVPDSVPGRDTFFEQELVQTLAGGDPALLG